MRIFFTLSEYYKNMYLVIFCNSLLQQSTITRLPDYTENLRELDIFG